MERDDREGSAYKTLLGAPREVGNESYCWLSDCRARALTLGLHQPLRSDTECARRRNARRCHGAALGAAAGGGPGAALGAAVGGGVGLVGGAASTPAAPGYWGYYGYPSYGCPGYGYPPSSAPPPFGYADPPYG